MKTIKRALYVALTLTSLSLLILIYGVLFDYYNENLYFTSRILTLTGFIITFICLIYFYFKK